MRVITLSFGRQTSSNIGGGNLVVVILIAALLIISRWQSAVWLGKLVEIKRKPTHKLTFIYQNNVHVKLATTTVVLTSKVRSGYPNFPSTFRTYLQRV